MQTSWWLGCYEGRVWDRAIKGSFGQLVSVCLGLNVGIPCDTSNEDTPILHAQVGLV